jgi:hypothetical protein
MDVAGWLLWTLTTVASLIGSVAWFLLGGWVVTAVQLVVIVFGVFAYKYGWRRAPIEFTTKVGGFVRFLWAWVRAKEASLATNEPRTARGREIRIVHRRQPGDVNLSTLLTLVMFVGLGAIALT